MFVPIEVYVLGVLGLFISGLILLVLFYDNRTGLSAGVWISEHFLCEKGPTCLEMYRWHKGSVVVNDQRCERNPGTHLATREFSVYGLNALKIHPWVAWLGAGLFCAGLIALVRLSP